MVQNEKIKYKLTIRYVIALALIACVITTGYIVLVSQLTANKNDGHYINISGMQRMLSQRIALMATQVDVDNDLQSNQKLITEMNDAIDKMSDNHKQLVTNVWEKDKETEIYAIYYGNKGLDVRVSNYLDISRQFVSAYNLDNNNWDHLNALREKIEDTAINNLLADLNKAVYLFETQATNKVSLYKKIETIIFLVGLTVLILEVIFIFRPMTAFTDNIIKSLQKSNDELLEFSYRISHDLRAPVVSALGLSSAASKSLENENYKIVGTALREINISMTKLNKLIDDILAVTGLIKSEILTEDVNIEAMISDILVKLKNLDNYENVKVNVDLTDMPETILTKRLLLAQSVENLVSNAIKYSDPENTESYIDIVAKKTSAGYKFTVSDNGIGVPEEFRDKLFGMFARFHPEVSFGSGLGLYLVKQQVESLGGSITYKPLEKGSSFEITMA